MQLIFNSVQEVFQFVASLREAQKPSQTTQPTSQKEATQSKASEVSQLSQRVEKPQNQTTKSSQSANANSQAQENPNKASEKQIKLIFILLKKLGVSEKEVRLNLVSNILGRKISSFSQLSKSEATKIIKHLSEKVPA